MSESGREGGKEGMGQEKVREWVEGEVWKTHKGGR